MYIQIASLNFLRPKVSVSRHLGQQCSFRLDGRAKLRSFIVLWWLFSDWNEWWWVFFIFTFISTTALGLRRCSLWHLIRLKDDCLPWWRHQMETFSALLAIRAGNSPVPGEFPTQRPVTRSFDVFFDLRLNKWLRKQWWGWWFETLSRPLWRHRNAVFFFQQTCMTITVCTAICVEI